MKTIFTALLLLIWSVVNAEPIKEPKLPKEVRQFILDALQDEKGEYQNIEKKLLAIPKEERGQHHDRKLELLSGLVWKVDRKRAYALLEHIQSKELQEKIRTQYQGFERVNSKPSKTN